MNTNYTPPKCPDGFSFVAAATLFKNFGGLAVYVKYKKSSSRKIKVKQITSNFMWVTCPDREIIIQRNTYDTSAFVPHGESFDECLDLSLFNDYTLHQLGIEYVMTNFAHSTKTKNSRVLSKIEEDKRATVLSDSGGLQLARGVSGLIHPIDLMNFYNNNVDAGMVLDFPLFLLDADEALLKRAAKLQKKHNEIMLKHSNGVELINIFHGHSLHQRQMFRGIVETPYITRCAIGGLYQHSLLTGTNIIFDLILNGVKYKQYHTLGIFSTLYLPVLVKLANSGWKPHITSDSTSHIQSAVLKLYHFQFDIFDRMLRLSIGNRESIENTYKVLPCQCAVCSTIKYTDILGFGDNKFSTELLAIHNAIEMVRYTKQLQEACRHMTDKEYAKLALSQLKGHKGIKDLQQTLDFISMVNNYGLKAARKKYTHYVESHKAKSILLPPSLFESREQVNLDSASTIDLLARMEKQMKIKP